MEQIEFDPANATEALRQLPHSPAVFALYGADAHAEPYIGRTPNLNARLARLLQPSPKHPRRLQLAGLVRRIEYCLSGSDFESLLAQFSLLEEVYGAKVLDRMHLRMPAFVRYLGGNPYPRITVTNRPSLRESDWSYGPFPSRAAAERYAEEVLKLFLLRRCTFELDPDPAYPGCVYSEMKMCLAPCFKGCTDERYQEESAAVESFFATRGESRLVPLRAQREEASADLEFESAAAIHAQVQRVESVRALASELVRPLSQLRAVILQASAQPGEVSVFLFADGRLRGPAAFSTLGMRIQNEQSGSSSLFAQPLALEPTPEEQGLERQGTGNREQGIEQQGIGNREQGIEQQGTGNREQGIEQQGTGNREQGIEQQGTGNREQGIEEQGIGNREQGIEQQGIGGGEQGTENGPSQSEGALEGHGVSGHGVSGHGVSEHELSGHDRGTQAVRGSRAEIGKPTERALAAAPASEPARTPRSLLESRMEAAIASLAESETAPSATIRQGHLALLKRWYYRPETRRAGEIFFPDGEGHWPIKALLRGAGRVAAKTLSAAGPH
jgi:excinuclease ABC subunit C